MPTDKICKDGMAQHMQSCTTSTPFAVLGIEQCWKVIVAASRTAVAAVFVTVAIAMDDNGIKMPIWNDQAALLLVGSVSPTWPHIAACRVTLPWHNRRTHLSMFCCANRYSMLKLGLAPCSPFTVTKDLMIAAAELARKHEGVRRALPRPLRMITRHDTRKDWAVIQPVPSQQLVPLIFPVRCWTAREG